MYVLYIEYPLQQQESIYPSTDSRIGPIQVMSITNSFNYAKLQDSPSNNSGILHLYKDKSQETNLLLSNSKNLVAVLAVPCYFSPTDLLNFISSYQSHSDYIKIIRDSLPNRYIVLIQFKDSKTVDSFIEEYNGIKYSEMEPEICQVVPIQLIEYHDSILLQDKHLIELPMCPVCLERLDSNVTGLISTVCGHSYHCDCIRKWGTNSCPVCRYSHDSYEKDESSVCCTCQTDSDLWICLICGHLGCGRYKSGHARDHYTSSGHIYALELETQRVWDYLGDSYVHRLLRMDDGKLVELSLPSHSTDIQPQIIAKQDDSAHGDFATLLATQLESQRHYFESLLDKIEKTHHMELTTVLERMECLELEQKESIKSKESLSIVSKERKSLEKRVDKLTRRMEFLESSLEEEKALNSILLLEQDKFKKSIQDRDVLLTSKETEITELKEQTRDLMFYLETMEKSAANQELAGASIVTVQPTCSKKKKKK